MLTQLFDIPANRGSSVWSPTVADVLQVCNTQFRGDGGSPAWSHCRPLNALIHPGERIQVAVVLLDDPTTTPDRYWPQETIVSFHLPVRAPVSRRAKVVELAGRPAEAYLFPDDRRLRSLRTLASSSGAGEMWRRWYGLGESDPVDLKRQLLRYLPEHKFVARLRNKASDVDDQVDGVAVRCCPPRRAAELADRHKAARKALKNRPRSLDVPRMIGGDVEMGITAVEWIKGDGLLDALSTGNEEQLLSMLAEALSEFHQMSVSGLPTVSPKSLARTVELASADLSGAGPEFEDSLSRLIPLIHRQLRSIGSNQAVTLHHDFYFDQVRVRKHRCTIVDLERVAIGDPLVDVANFVFQMRMLTHRPQFAVSAADAARWSDLFFEQWQRVAGPCDRHRFSAYYAVSALSLARGLMRHLRPGWREPAHHCLAEANRLMDELDPTGRHAAATKS